MPILEKTVTKTREIETVKKLQTFLRGNKTEDQSAGVKWVSKGKGSIHILKEETWRIPLK